MHHIKKPCTGKHVEPLASRNVARVFPEVVPGDGQSSFAKTATFTCTFRSRSSRHSSMAAISTGVKRRWKETLLVSDLYKVMAGLIW